MSEAKIFYQSDCNLSLLEGKTIAIIGYGSQGHAHALNLHESGVNVVVGLYEGSKSRERADEKLNELNFAKDNIFSNKLKLSGIEDLLMEQYKKHRHSFM